MLQFDVELSGSRLYPEFGLFLPIVVTAYSNQIIVSGVPTPPWSYKLQAGTVESNTF
jgi:hypothetical protein